MRMGFAHLFQEGQSDDGYTKIVSKTGGKQF